MINKQDVIQMLTDWKNQLGSSYHEEILSTVLEITINKIQAMPEKVE